MATVTITAPGAPVEAWQTYTLGASSLATSGGSYKFVVTDPDGSITTIPFTASGTSAPAGITYVPHAAGTLTVAVQANALAAAETSATATVPGFN